MQNRVDHYFKSISMTEYMFDMVLDGKTEDGKDKFKKIPKLNDNGEQYKRILWLETPTVCGLAEHLGMTRQTLNEYGKTEKFSDTTKKAKARVERYLEEGLDGKDVTGRIFNLKNNFGWVDKTEVDATVSQTINITGEVKNWGV